ncbi:hypothetical protein XELAEV_18019307mg [Xenopus laevis]|uniref:G-protein coupled receptors family 3 profile domain-containing protein n=1 Tax=Xenopus laevis TaxID=8355 RepID=A0A974DGI8_XENLA|nr:hypothetical protein XELAEV_18019307mg [Xenopus laevis]
MNTKRQRCHTTISGLQPVTVLLYSVAIAVGSCWESGKSCSLSSGNMSGKPICCFQCVRCPQGQISNQTDAVMCEQCLWDTWSSFQQDKCIPKAIDFLSYEELLGLSLAAISISSSVVPLCIVSIFMCHKTTPVVRANNYSLSCLLLLSLFLCFLCSLGFIGYPQSEMCLLRQVAFGMVFSLCISSVLAKTITVVIAFTAIQPGSRLKRWTSVKVSYCVVVFCMCIQLSVCIVWLSFSPPFPEYDIITQPGVIIINCNEGSPIAFWCMLGFLGILASISFIVAFLARRLPDSFNEAKFITFSMLAFLTVWISFIPAYFSARGKYTVAMEIFAILSSTWAMVACIFMPKCYIILLTPDMNSRELLMRRGRAQCANIRSFQSWQTKDGINIFFNGKQKPPAVYDIVNWCLGSKGRMEQVVVEKPSLNSGFIGYPQPEMCLLHQVSFGMVFAIFFTNTVVIAFKVNQAEVISVCDVADLIYSKSMVQASKKHKLVEQLLKLENGHPGTAAR